MGGINRDDVPDSLRHLIPVAERWGIGDDIERDQEVESASEFDRKTLVDSVDLAPAELWEWLAADASRPHPTSAYVAFTCMTMAADLARITLEMARGQPPAGRLGRVVGDDPGLRRDE